MFQLFAAGLMAVTAQASEAQSTLEARCVLEGNNATECQCAAGIIVDALDDRELGLMVDLMVADTSNPENVASIGAEHGFTLEDIMATAAKLQSTEAQMVEQCGIEPD